MKSCGTIQSVGSRGALCVRGGTFTSSSKSVMKGGCSGPCTESGASPLSSVNSLASSNSIMGLGLREPCAGSGASMQRSSIKPSSERVGLRVGRTSASMTFGSTFGTQLAETGGAPSAAPSSVFGDPLPFSGSFQVWLPLFLSLAEHLQGKTHPHFVQRHFSTKSEPFLLSLMTKRPPKMQQLTTNMDANMIPMKTVAPAEAS